MKRWQLIGLKHEQHTLNLVSTVIIGMVLIYRLEHIHGNH